MEVKGPFSNGGPLNFDLPSLTIIRGADLALQAYFKKCHGYFMGVQASS